MKCALITGITGQDGSYLAELLLSKPEYEIHGLVRRSSSLNRQRIDHLFAGSPSVGDRFQLHYADLADASSLAMVIEQVRPDEVYNLGAQSHVRVSFDQPLYTADVVGLGTLRLLEAVRHLNRSKTVKFYQASSSEMFGAAPPPQGLDTPFHPRSPYACAKLYAHWQTINYREAYGLFACSGVLFNHESPRRGESFVTRKVTLGAARIKEGLQKKLVMGNLEAKRDWGFAGDYVRAMWLMLQQEKPDDYVVATGDTHSVRELLELAFELVGLDYHDFVDFDQ
jgi:GDPmannose 4,6-dehydratase